MDGILYKDFNNYHLLIDDKLFASTDNNTIKEKLSIKNCQEIELGYDLNDIINENCDKWNTEKANGIEIGFQKALEILGDKKFSEDDVHQALHLMNNRTKVPIVGEALDIIAKMEKQRNEIIQSLQKTEWSVEIVMDICGDKVYEVPEISLDKNNCLVLKRKYEKN